MPGAYGLMEGSKTHVTFGVGISIRLKKELHAVGISASRDLVKRTVFVRPNLSFHRERLFAGKRILPFLEVLNNVIGKDVLQELPQGYAMIPAEWVVWQIVLHRGA